MSHWNSLSDQELLEAAWDLCKTVDPEPAACIHALLWRYKGTLEWLESKKRQ